MGRSLGMIGDLLGFVGGFLVEIDGDLYLKF